MIKPQHERIDWSRTAIEIHNQVRALSPNPGAHTIWQGDSWKILRTEVPASPTQGPPGTVGDIHFNTIRVNTGNGILEILEFQPAGKKPMSAAAYLRGHVVERGTRLEYTKT